MTARDVLVLRDLLLWGVLLRGQIQTLYFGSVQRTNARLLELSRHGYVTSTQLMVAPYGASTALAGGQRIYMLGKAGVEVVAEATGLDIAVVRAQQKRGTPTYLLHCLEGVQFRLALLSAGATQPDVKIEQILPEILCRHDFDVRTPGGKWQHQAFRPDLLAIAFYRGERFAWPVEIDRGHVSNVNWLIKARSLSQFLGSTLFTERYGMCSTAILVVTTTEKRRDSLNRLLAEEGYRQFRFATFTDVRDSGAFGTVWYTALSRAPIGLLP